MRISRPPIDVIVRSSSSQQRAVVVRPPSTPSTMFEVPERDRVDQRGQSAAERIAIIADVREVRLLRVAQVVHDGASRGDRGRIRRSRPNPSSPVVTQLLDQPVASARVRVERPRLQPASFGKPAGDTDSSEQIRDVRWLRPRSTSSRGRSTASSSALVCRPPAPAYSAFVNSPSRDQQVRRHTPTRAVPGLVDQRLQSDCRTMRHQKRGLARVEITRESVNVPGDTTRTTSRLTMPLAFRGSST